MDEQTTPTPEPVIMAPNPAVVDTATTEPPQAEPALAPTEPISIPLETAQNVPETEPIAEQPPAPIELPTAHMGRNEPLPEVIPEPASQGAVAPEVETLTPTATPILNESPSEETPPKTEESPRTAPPPQSQQGTTQPEPTPAPVSPMPAQAQIPPPQNIVGLILTKARAVIQLRKQKKLIKIMSLFAKQTSITNDAVEKLLHVSDATATRYLSELEKQGKITQSGKTGHAVTYTKR